MSLEDTGNDCFYIGIEDDFVIIKKLDEENDGVNSRYPNEIFHNIQKIEYAINEASLIDLNYKNPCTNISLAMPVSFFLATNFTLEKSFKAKNISQKDIKMMITDVIEKYIKHNKEYIVDIHFGESTVDDAIVTMNPVNLYGSKIKIDITVISISSNNWSSISSIAKRNKFIINDCYPQFLAKSLNFYKNYISNRKQYENLLFIEIGKNETEFCLISKMNTYCLESISCGYKNIINKISDTLSIDDKEAIKILHSLGSISSNNYNNHRIISESKRNKITIGHIKKQIREEFEIILKKIKNIVSVSENTYSKVIVYDNLDITGLDVLCSKVLDINYVSVYSNKKDDDSKYKKIHNNYIANRYISADKKPQNIVKKKISELYCFLENMVYN